MQDAQKPEVPQAVVKPPEFKPGLLLRLDPKNTRYVELVEKWKKPEESKKVGAWEEELNGINKYPDAQKAYKAGDRIGALVLVYANERGIKLTDEDVKSIGLKVAMLATTECKLPITDKASKEERNNTDLKGLVENALEIVFVTKIEDVSGSDQQEKGTPNNKVDKETSAEDQSLAHAGSISPEAARSIIDLMAKGNNLQKALEARVAELKKEGASPEDLALAIDLELAGIEWRLSAINEKAQSGRKISPKLETELSDLSNKYKDLTEQRNSGKVKLSDGVIKEIANFDEQPNQIKKLAEKLGIVDTKNPLEKMQNFIEEAVGNKEFRDQFTAKIMKLAEDGLLTREQATQLNKFLEDSAKNKSIENKAKFAAKGAAFGGLFMFLMLYLAKKQSGSQGGGGGMMG